MRHPTSIVLVASALLIIGALAPRSAPAEGPRAPQPPAQAQAPAPGTPAPYKPVPIKLPTVITDPSFEAFRKTLLGVAEKKDRAALARLIAKDFFWFPEETDVADKTKPGIENLAKALGLDGTNAQGWNDLVLYAREPSGMNDPQRNGVICAPGEPEFDDRAAIELGEATQTEPSDWGYPTKDGVEVRSATTANAPVIDKLGLYLVRILADDSPANVVNQTHWKVATPTGKVGFVTIDLVSPLITEQMCYRMEAGAWKIAGYLGGLHGR